MKEIPLTRGLVAIVDDQDFEELLKYKWHALKGKFTFYAARSSGKKVILMHRQILGISERTMFVDHINGIGVDNCRTNIRACSMNENNTNKRGYKNNISGAKGVGIMKGGKKWRALITHNKKQVYLGCFDTPTEAAKAYNEAALRLHGEFAFLNQV